MKIYKLGVPDVDRLKLDKKPFPLKKCEKFQIKILKVKKDIRLIKDEIESQKDIKRWSEKNTGKVKIITDFLDAAEQHLLSAASELT